MWSYQGGCLDIIEGHRVGVADGWWVWQMGGGRGRWVVGVADRYTHCYFSDCIQGRNIWSMAVNYDQTLVVSWL